MKIANVVNQLAKIIPQETDFFSDTIIIDTISSDGSLVFVKTLGVHGLSNGDFINARDVKTKNPIVSADFTVVKGVSTLEVATNIAHDLTLNPREKTKQFVELSGFTDSSWNAKLELILVPNRKSFTVINGTATLPILTGLEVLIELVLGQFNGPQTIAVVDTLNFTYSSNFVAGGQGGDIQSNIRIAGIVNFQRSLEQYTTHLADKFFMFVVAPTSTIANKSRGAQTDINDEQTLQGYFNQDIKDGFIILVVANVTSEAGALKSMDTIRDVVFKSLLLAVRGHKFNSGLSVAPNQVTNFLSHGTLAYDNARYVHQFIFEMPLVMSVCDAVQPETRAFRDIDFTNSHPDNSDAPGLTANIDLDDTKDTGISGTVIGNIGQLDGAFSGSIT